MSASFFLNPDCDDSNHITVLRVDFLISPVMTRDSYFDDLSHNAVTYCNSLSHITITSGMYIDVVINVSISSSPSSRDCLFLNQLARLFIMFAVLSYWRLRLFCIDKLKLALDAKRTGSEGKAVVIGV